MTGAFVSILIGLIILLGIVFEITISFSIAVEIFFGIVFLADGFKVFKHPKSDKIGSLIFGSILIMDAFDVFAENLGFWQIILLMIASYLVGWGIYSVFTSSKFINVKNNRIEDKHMKIEVPKNLNRYDIKYFLDWTKLNFSSRTTEDYNIQVDSYADADIFKRSFNWNDSELNIENKLKVSNIKVPERSKMNTGIRTNLKYNLSTNLSVSDVFFDLRNSYPENININSTASKIVLIPSNKKDSSIDADLEISTITVKLSENVGLVLNQLGELNLRTFEGLIEREDGSFISANFSEAEYTCYLNISSEMSRLSIQLI
ncbi:MAG: hypothetical protein ACQESN_01075 [Thermotogota bacterium]